MLLQVNIIDCFNYFQFFDLLYKIDAHKRKPAHVSRRTSSAESANQIRMVDDNSLDSTSENNSDFEPQRRRHIKPKKKDVETNTEVMFDVEPHKQQRSFFDERGNT